MQAGKRLKRSEVQQVGLDVKLEEISKEMAALQKELEPLKDAPEAALKS